MNHIVFNLTRLSYKRDMPLNGTKKSEQVLINLSPEVHALITQIAQTEDRPLGYVARELMLRGMNLYEHDGLLRDRQLPDISAHAQNEIGKLRKVNGNIEPTPDMKIAFVEDMGELTDESKKKRAAKPIKKRAGR